MLTADTNLFIHAADPDSLHHQKARDFFQGLASEDMCTVVRMPVESGFFLVLVTNQSGVGRGLMALDALQRIHAPTCSRSAACSSSCSRASCLSKAPPPWPWRPPG